MLVIVSGDLTNASILASITKSPKRTLCTWQIQEFSQMVIRPNCIAMLSRKKSSVRQELTEAGVHYR